MGDTTMNLRLGKDTPIKLIDNGDGTYSISTSGGGGSTGDGTSKIVDGLGNQAEVGLFGGLKTTQSNTQISLVFNKPINETRDLIVSNGVESQVNRSLLRVGNFIGTSFAQSVDNVRYKTAQTLEANFTANWSRVTNATEEAYIGLFDEYDGVYFGYNSNSDFIVAYRNVFGSATASWDGNNVVNPVSDVVQIVDMSSYDLSKIHRFRIRFGYLGVGNITIEIKPSGDETYQVLHTFNTDGALSDRTHIGDPKLSIRSEVTSLDTTLNILSGSWNGQTYGVDTNQQEEPFYTKGNRVVSVNDGEELGFVAFRNLKTFGGYPNKVKSRLLNSQFATGSEGIYRINLYFYPEGTITGGSWNPVANNESVVEINETIALASPPPNETLAYATVITVGSGLFGSTSPDSANANFESLGLVLPPTFEVLFTKECIIEGGGNDETTWDIAYADLF